MNNEYFFIYKKNIALHINENGINPGECFKLLEYSIKKHPILEYEKIEKNIGLSDNKKLFFSKNTFDLNLYGKKYYLVNKNNIFGEV
jgi:hypothetical protein